MGILARDAYEVENPALCAVTQWRFSVAYQDESNKADGPPVQLLFLLAPLLLHPESRRLILSTQVVSGLRQFAEKFSRASETQADILLSLNHRVLAYRELSLRGLQIATTSGLLTVRASSADVLPLSRTRARLTRPEARAFLRASHRLGAWMSRLSMYEIALILKVRL